MAGPAHDLSKLRINRAQPPEVRRSYSRTLILTGGAVLALLVGLVFFLRSRRSAVVDAIVVAMPSAGADATAPGATVVTANGYVVARTRASVSAKVPGRLAHLSVDEGSFARKGEVIALLENDDYKAAVAQARANVASAEAQEVEAETERDQSRRERDRVVTIRAENPNLLSAQDSEQAEARLAQATARAASAVAQSDAARAAMRFAEANLDNTVIRAPFTGTVLRKEAEVGEVVAPSVGGGLTRGAVVTMADLSTLEVEVDVNEAYIGRVSREQPARITLDAYPDTSFRGTVRQVVPTADRQRATVQVKVSIQDRDQRILPEMGARVDFVAPRAEEAAASNQPAAPPVFRLPVSAVRERAGKSVVWLIREGRLVPQEVEAGPASAGFREVRRGLSGGEQVLTGGVENPVEGIRVQVRQAGPASPAAP